jgi:hypothetical protein
MDPLLNMLEDHLYPIPKLCISYLTLITSNSCIMAFIPGLVFELQRSWHQYRAAEGLERSGTHLKFHIPLQAAQ